jgi:hypothetical protein
VGQASSPVFFEGIFNRRRFKTGGDACSTGKQHVARLQIAVDDAALVGGVDGAGSVQLDRNG